MAGFITITFCKMKDPVFLSPEHLSIYQPGNSRPYNEHRRHNRTHIAPVVRGECRGLKDDVHHGNIDDRYLKQHRKNYSPDKIQV